MPTVNPNIYTIHGLTETEVCWQSPAKLTGQLYQDDKFKCDFTYYLAIDAFSFPDYVRHKGQMYFASILRRKLDIEARWDGNSGRNKPRVSRSAKKKAYRQSRSGVRPGVAA